MPGKSRSRFGLKVRERSYERSVVSGAIGLSALIHDFSVGGGVDFEALVESVLEAGVALDY